MKDEDKYDYAKEGQKDCTVIVKVFKDYLGEIIYCCEHRAPDVQTKTAHNTGELKE